jgi:hypothetical protein
MQISEVHELRLEASDGNGWALATRTIKNLMKARKEFSREEIDALQI